MKKKVQMKKNGRRVFDIGNTGNWSFPAGKRVCGCKSGAGRRSRWL